jgi:hypothetical protein
VLDACNWIPEVCEDALQRIATKKSGSYHNMTQLAADVKEIVDMLQTNSGFKTPEATGPESESRMVLLDLMYASRRSRLYSLAKTLSTIESLSHICVWTKDSCLTLNESCSLDLVDLPRLKLTFTPKVDSQGNLRLFSVDHADLFISNEHNPFTAKLMVGIPHALLVANLRGEQQLLVPLLPPYRPSVASLPFSSELVLDRSDAQWFKDLSQHFYLYPVHVSQSFLMTRGLNSALYLLLLRLLNRDYSIAFRMCDGIATDSKFSAEGTQIFHALAFASDDMHPDAHAVRLNVLLVTIESGVTAPWDLTSELAYYIAKLPHVSADCVLSEQEELQLLSSDFVVLDESSSNYCAELHSAYHMTLVKNRKHLLYAALTEQRAGEWLCFAPPRIVTSSWVWYKDDTIFGEKYNETIDIKSQDDWSTNLEYFKCDSLRNSLAPPEG